MCNKLDRGKFAKPAGRLQGAKDFKKDLRSRLGRAKYPMERGKERKAKVQIPQTARSRTRIKDRGSLSFERGVKRKKAQCERGQGTSKQVHRGRGAL